MAKKLDVDNNKITILTKGPAVFVMVGEEAFFSIGLDGENYLEIYDIALTEDSLDSAGGLFGEWKILWDLGPNTGFFHA